MLIDNFFPRLKLIALPLATSLFFLGAPLANADIEMFVEVDGVKGQTGDREFPDAIRALEWSWGMNQVALPYATDIVRNKASVNFQELTFTHYLDVATPSLMRLCANGKPIPEVSLTLRAAGRDGPVNFVEITLSGVMVSNITTSATPSDVTEQVSLRFAKVEFKYILQRPDGTKAGPVPFQWNLATNTER